MRKKINIYYHKMNDSFSSLEKLVKFGFHTIFRSAVRPFKEFPHDYSLLRLVILPKYIIKN